MILNMKRASGSISELKRRVSFPVYQEPADRDIMGLLGGSKDDFLIFDRCGLLAYHFKMPRSYLMSPFVRNALIKEYTKKGSKCKRHCPIKTTTTATQSTTNKPIKTTTTATQSTTNKPIKTTTTATQSTTNKPIKTTTTATQSTTNKPIKTTNTATQATTNKPSTSSEFSASYSSESVESQPQSDATTTSSPVTTTDLALIRREETP